jgi:hypothetical protein
VRRSVTCTTCRATSGCSTTIGFSEERGGWGSVFGRAGGI